MYMKYAWLYTKKCSSEEWSLQCTYQVHVIIVHVLKILTYKPFQPNFTSFPFDHGSLPFILCYCVYLKFNVNLSFKCKVNYGFDFTGDDYIGTGNLFNVSILPVDSIQRFTAHSLLCVQYPQIRRNWCEYQNFVWS